MSRYVPSEYSFICLFFYILIFGVHVIIVMRPTNYIPTWGQGGTQRSWGWSFPIPHTAIPNQVKTLTHLDPEKWHPNIAKWKGKKKVHENSSQSPCTFGPHFHLIFCLLFFFYTGSWSHTDFKYNIPKKWRIRWVMRSSSRVKCSISSMVMIGFFVPRLFSSCFPAWSCSCGSNRTIDALLKHPVKKKGCTAVLPILDPGLTSCKFDFMDGRCMLILLNSRFMVPFG